MSLRRRITVNKEGGKLRPGDREAISRLYQGLPDGMYEVSFASVGYRNKGRYKYYFSYLLPSIIQALNIKAVDKLTGEERDMTGEELHEICKEKFNPIRFRDPFTKRWKTRGGTTTALADDEFIPKFEEEVAAHFISEYGIELLNRDEWREKMHPSRE